MRYAVNGDIEISEVIKYDVVIIGAGLAGLYTALNLDPGISCCVIAKENIDTSSSYLAQGGIAAAISTDDTPFLHYEDTLTAGAGLCDKEAVRILVDEGPGDVRKLVSMEVPFDLNEFGDLQITREGGHSKNRVVHAGGDATGRETVNALSYILAQRENIAFLERTFFMDIVTSPEGGVCGVIVRRGGNDMLLSTKNVVIATGGIGQAYLHSTNPDVATGDGIAAAMRAGAEVKNLEFIQFHPTGLWSPQPEDRAFLISEALRGEGGLLKNAKGERFMVGLHPLAELAPRDIVAREIYKELRRSGETHAFIDITCRSEEYLRNRFPTIYYECLRRGINISKDWIPVCPVQHYLTGGIVTDLHGRTNVPGLYACGEVAYTGVHGANRLASNSMLECLVFGRRSAEDLNKEVLRQTIETSCILPDMPVRPSCGDDIMGLRQSLRQCMEIHVGVIRTDAGLGAALEFADGILNKLKNCCEDTKEYYETLNITMISKEIISAAIRREESIGSHYKEG